MIWEGPVGSGTGTGGALVLDRQGTAVVKDGQRVSYFPYGEPRVGAGDHFATYQRDATTSFDYAMNRYYSNVAGRFLTPDPYRRSAHRSNPQSWNRYAYVQGDPVNANDPSGLDDWEFTCSGSPPQCGWFWQDLPSYPWVVAPGYPGMAANAPAAVAWRDFESNPESQYDPNQQLNFSCDTSDPVNAHLELTPFRSFRIDPR